MNNQRNLRLFVITNGSYFNYIVHELFSHIIYNFCCNDSALLNVMIYLFILFKQKIYQIFIEMHFQK